MKTFDIDMGSAGRKAALAKHARDQLSQPADMHCAACGKALTIAEVFADRCNDCGADLSMDKRELPF